MRIDSFDHPCESQPALNTEILTPPRSSQNPLRYRVAQRSLDPFRCDASGRFGDSAQTRFSSREGATCVWVVHTSSSMMLSLPRPLLRQRHGRHHSPVGVRELGPWQTSARRGDRRRRRDVSVCDASTPSDGNPTIERLAYLDVRSGNGAPTRL